MVPWTVTNCESIVIGGTVLVSPVVVNERSSLSSTLTDITVKEQDGLRTGIFTVTQNPGGCDVQTNILVEVVGGWVCVIQPKLIYSPASFRTYIGMNSQKDVTLSACG